MDQYAQHIYEKYIEGIVIDGKGDRNLYFKNYTQLRPDDDNSYDYVSGYIPIENYNDDDIWTINFGGSDHYMFGINTDAGTINGSGQ